MATRLAIWLVVLVLFFTSAVHAALSQTDTVWLDFWNRCRAAIEHGNPVDHTGLELASTREDILGTRVTVWTDPHSMLEIVEGDRQCRVTIKADKWPQNAAELIAITGTFERQRQELIGAGSYESVAVERQSAAYHVAMRSVGRRANGCRVVAALIVAPEKKSFISVWAEQVFAEPCGDSSSTSVNPTP